MDNNIEKLIFENMSEMTGLEEDELEEIRENNLFEDGILDSLSLVNLIGMMEDELGVKVNLASRKLEEFANINAIIDFFEKL